MVAVPAVAPMTAAPMTVSVAAPGRRVRVTVAVAMTVALLFPKHKQNENVSI